MTVVLHTKRGSVKAPALRQGFSFVRAGLLRHARCVARAALIALCVSLLFSCASTRRAPYTFTAQEANRFIPQQIVWHPLYEGADYFCYENKAFPVRYHCIKIDLTTPNLRILTFPAHHTDFKSQRGERSPFFIGKRTGTFAKKSGADIAINSSPFAGKNGTWDLYAHLTRTRQIVGTHIVSKEAFSAPNQAYCALTFKKVPHGWEARIIDAQTEDALAEADFAFGGFWTILRDQEKRAFSFESHDSRTAAGTSADGKTLFLLVVEGERIGMSKGLSYPECADIFLALGADTAMEFDGGGSSSLFIGGKNMLAYPSVRINAASIGFSFFH